MEFVILQVNQFRSDFFANWFICRYDSVGNKSAKKLLNSTPEKESKESNTSHMSRSSNLLCVCVCVCWSLAQIHMPFH